MNFYFAENETSSNLRKILNKFLTGCSRVLLPSVEQILKKVYNQAFFIYFFYYKFTLKIHNSKTFKINFISTNKYIMRSEV